MLMHETRSSVVFHVGDRDADDAGGGPPGPDHRLCRPSGLPGGRHLFGSRPRIYATRPSRRSAPFLGRPFLGGTERWRGDRCRIRLG